LDKPLLPQGSEVVAEEDDNPPFNYYDDTSLQEAEEDSGERVSAIVQLAHRPCKFGYLSMY